MTIKIRLARGGAKKRPHYRLVIANSSSPRDGRFLEKVGTYNPMIKSDDSNRVILKVDRIEYWLSVGAQPTERVAQFIENAGVVLPEAIKRKVLLRLKMRKAKPPKKQVS